MVEQDKLTNGRTGYYSLVQKVQLGVWIDRHHIFVKNCVTNITFHFSKMYLKRTFCYPFLQIF